MRQQFRNSQRHLRAYLRSGNTAKRILLAVAIALIILLVWVVFFYGRSSFDQRVFDLVAPHISDSRTQIMRFISFLGKHSFLLPTIGFMLGYFIVRKNKWMAIRTSVILVTSLLLMSFLKNLLHRDRPLDPLVLGITNFSFPSGHAFMSVAFYGLLIWWASVKIRTLWLRNSVIVFLLFLIAAIGFSRIYLRVHYATDVVAGICFGFVWLDFCLWFFDKKQTNAEKLKQLEPTSPP